MSRLPLVWTLLAACCGLTPPSAAAAEGSNAVRHLGLHEAMKMAVAAAPDVAMARAQALRAASAAREVRSLNLPQLFAGTGLAYNNGFPLSIEGAAPSIFQAGVSQPLFSSRNRKLLEEAEESRRAADVGPDAAGNDAAAAAALAYAELHFSRKSAVVWEARVQSLKRHAAAEADLVQAGRIRPVDLLQAEGAMLAAEQQLASTAEQARLAELELKLLTGLPRGESISTDEPALQSEFLGAPPDRLFERALQTHPSLRRAEAELRARELHLGAEDAGRYPRFDLIGQYALFSRANNYQDYFNRFTRNNFIIGMSIQVPLFDSGRIESRTAQGRQEVQEARSRVELLKRDLRLGLEKAASGLRLARGAETLARREETIARESLRVNEALFEGGRIAPAALELSRSAVMEKELAVLRLSHGIFTRQVELLRAMGVVAQLP